MTNYSSSNNKKRQSTSRKRKKKVKNKARVIVFRVFISALLISVFAGAGAVFGAYMGIIDSVELIDSTTVVEPRNFISIVFDKDGNEIDRFTGAENRENATLDQIPLHLQHAFIAIEDERFFTHNGIDARGIARSFVETVFRNNTQGASTITQQLIKLNFMGLQRNTLTTKIQEQYLAVRYERMLEEQLGSKEAAKNYILRQYLNSVPLNHGLYGVQTAARFYFNKEVSELTLSESAVIAAITQRPTALAPTTNPERNRVRQVHVLDNMLRLGFITEEEHYYAYNDNVHDRVGQHRAQITDTDATRIRSWFADQIITEVARDLQNIGFSSQDAFDLIYSGGLRIHTTMDPNIQNILEETFLDDSFFSARDFRIDVIYFLSLRNTITGQMRHLEEEFSVREYSEIAGRIQEIQNMHLTTNMTIVADRYIPTVQPQAAMVVLDHRTGHVRGIVGGRGEKTVNRAFNRAVQATRQPGSVFKMVAAFAPAFDLGLITPGTLLMDEPFTYELPGGSYTPNNWWGSQFRGARSARYAVVHSANVMSVRLMVETGIDASFDYLSQFGFTTLVDGEVRNGQIFTDRGPALALGGLTDGVTVLETAAAFGVMANNGIYMRPTFYTRVYDHDGTILLEHIPEMHMRQVIQPTTAFMLTDTMRDSLISGTGTRARLANMASAGKTGTTQNTRDLTFAGYTPYFTAAIWYGFDKLEFLGDTANYHLDIWRHVMTLIHEDLEHRDFVMPEGLTRVEICSDSGKRVIPGLCDADIRGSRIVTDLVPINMISHDFCDIHETITIDTLTGLLASADTPEYRRFTFVGIVVDDEDLTGASHEIPRSMTMVGSTTRHPYFNAQNLDSTDDYGDGPTMDDPTTPNENIDPPTTDEPALPDDEEDGEDGPVMD